MLKQILMGLFVGTFAVTTAQAAPAPQALFFNACLDGEAKLGQDEAAQVGFSGLPRTIQAKYRVPESARVWRIGATETYLYLFNSSDGRGNTNKICGVASKDMETQALTRALDVRLAGSNDTTPRRSTQWLRPSDGYVVTVTTDDRYTVAQVDWLSDRDRKRVQDELDLFAQ